MCPFHALKRSLWSLEVNKDNRIGYQISGLLRYLHLGGPDGCPLCRRAAALASLFRPQCRFCVPVCMFLLFEGWEVGILFGRYWFGLGCRCIFGGRPRGIPSKLFLGLRCRLCRLLVPGHRTSQGANTLCLFGRTCKEGDAGARFLGLHPLRDAPSRGNGDGRTWGRADRFTGPGFFLYSGKAPLRAGPGGRELKGISSRNDSSGASCI